MYYNWALSHILDLLVFSYFFNLAFIQNHGDNEWFYPESNIIQMQCHWQERLLFGGCSLLANTKV